MQSFDAKAALQAVLGYVREELKGRSGRFLDRAERTLNEAWPRTLDLNERALMMQAARWLAANKAQIHTALHERLVEALAARPVSPTPELTTLRVLQGDELPIKLARDQMISKVMNQGRAELAALEARFEELERTGAYANPKALWPGALADGFVAVLRQFGVPPNVQRMVLEVYGEEGIRTLLEFYRGINQVLLEHGVGVDLTASGAMPAFVNLGTLPRDVDKSVFALARNLKPVLERLQRAMAGVSLASWKPGLLRELIERQFAQSAGAHAKPGLTRAQIHSIDHVEALLLDWLRDDRISARVREEIRRLTLPILAARLASREEFAAPDNPIRVFLRQLAVLGYRDQEFPLSSFDSLQMVVERIVAEQGGDPSSFRSAADALNTLSRHEVRRRLALHTKERIAQPGGPQETVATFAREAHRQVTAELTEHAAGLELPAEIKQFVVELLGPWMMVRYHRYGPDSAPWQQARSLAASFFDGLRPAVSSADEARKQALRARILEQARIRTQRSKAPPAKAQALLAGLERHLQALDASHEIVSPSTAQSRGHMSDNFLDALRPIPGR
jgi:hypothetical protein